MYNFWGVGKYRIQLMHYDTIKCIAISHNLHAFGCCAGAVEVDDVQMRSHVNQNFQFRHQGLEFAIPASS